MLEALPFDWSMRPQEMRKWLPDPRIIIEVGANDGQDTATMLDLFPQVLVYAFEPDLRPVKRFCQRLGNHPRCKLLCQAVSDRIGRATFFGSGGSAPTSCTEPCRTDWDMSGSILEATGHRELSPWVTFPDDARHRFTVPTTTLDCLVDANPNITAIDLIWIDAQGAEGLVLRGGQVKALPRTKLIYCESRWLGREEVEVYAGQPTMEELVAVAGPGFELVARYRENILLKRRG